MAQPRWPRREALCPPHARGSVLQPDIPGRIALHVCVFACSPRPPNMGLPRAPTSPEVLGVCSGQRGLSEHHRGGPGILEDEVWDGGGRGVTETPSGTQTWGAVESLPRPRGGKLASWEVNGDHCLLRRGLVWLDKPAPACGPAPQGRGEANTLRGPGSKAPNLRPRAARTDPATSHRARGCPQISHRVAVEHS